VTCAATLGAAICPVPVALSPLALPFALAPLVDAPGELAEIFVVVNGAAALEL
jgi:hypothetical protein